MYSLWKIAKSWLQSAHRCKKTISFVFEYFNDQYVNVVWKSLRAVESHPTIVNCLFMYSVRISLYNYLNVVHLSSHFMCTLVRTYIIPIINIKEHTITRCITYHKRRNWNPRMYLISIILARMKISESSNTCSNPKICNENYVTVKYIF